MKAIIGSDLEKKVNRTIKKIKKAIETLQRLGMTIEMEETETLYKGIVNHIYLRDRMNGKLYLQKHLFTLNKEK